MEKQFWGEMAMFAGYSGNSAYSWGGKRMLRYLPHRNLKGIAYLVNTMLHYRGITWVSTGYAQPANSFQKSTK
jgi:hypothetical protein